MWRVQPSTTNPDVLYFDALLQNLRSRLAIDDSQVYLVGMSNGSSFAQLLAASRPNKISGIVAHSGSLPKQIKPPGGKQPYPVMLIVGSKDSPSLIQDMRASAETYRDAGHPTELVIVKDRGHTWAKRYNGQMWKFLSGRGAN